MPLVSFIYALIHHPISGVPVNVFFFRSDVFPGQMNAIFGPGRALFVLPFPWQRAYNSVHSFSGGIDIILEHP